jgi:hypothetical protein
MTTDGELWHIVEAKRDDGTPTMFRIRELEPKRQLTKIFVVELPYPKTELSRLPNASDYRRLTEFDEQWLRPACSALGWEYVGSKTEDGSFFFYTYGCDDPNAMIEKLSPFDGALGFYDDEDPDWQEYGTLKELLDQAKAIPAVEPPPAPQHDAFIDGTPTPLQAIATMPTPSATNGKATAAPIANVKARASAVKPKPRPAATTKRKTKVKAKPAAAKAKPKSRSASKSPKRNAKAAKKKRR